MKNKREEEIESQKQKSEASFKKTPKGLKDSSSAAMSGDLSPFRDILFDDIFPELPADDDFSINDMKQIPFEDPCNFFDNLLPLSNSEPLPTPENLDLKSFLPPNTAQKKKRSKTIKGKRQDFKLFLPIVVPRKCEHCETTETPQWRGGPSGRGTLCNACGIRFSSNRLYPEYRPGSSKGGSDPGGEYSNRHKKILKIREKKNYSN